MNGLPSTDRFNNRGADYAIGRPSYPPEAIDLLFEGLDNHASLCVVDLGAGTGISSRLLAARADTVIAIEPNADMRAHAQGCSNIVWQSGTAESTGLPSQSAHLVTAFQSFHWFDHCKVLDEMARILVPNGRAALLYNVRDLSDARAAAYERLAEKYAHSSSGIRRENGAAAFSRYEGWSDVRAFTIRNEQRLDRDAIHARAASTSYIPREGLAAAKLAEELNAFFDLYANDGIVSIPMKTILTIANR
jgi:SAM-dependent methyltransferase